mgnify:CR=1 FL=1
MYKLIQNIKGRNIILGTENPDEMVSHSVLSMVFRPGQATLKEQEIWFDFVENNQSDNFPGNNLCSEEYNRETTAAIQAEQAKVVLVLTVGSSLHREIMQQV